MIQYVAFLRGINVGGKSIIKMSDLKDALMSSNLQNVSTYIQSGNVLFQSDSDNKHELAQELSSIIEKQFKLQVPVTLFSKKEWTNIIAAAPKWWGIDTARKHNIFIMIDPYDMQQVVAAIGVLKPGVEAMELGDGVLYQSMDRALLGRTTTGKLAGSPVYKSMTIRNYNTAIKMLTLMNS